MKRIVFSMLLSVLLGITCAAQSVTEDFNNLYDSDTYLGYNTIQGVYNTELPNGWTVVYTNKMSATQLYYSTTAGVDGSGALQHNATAAVTLVTQGYGGEGSTLSLDVKRNNSTNPNQYVKICDMAEVDGVLTVASVLREFNAAEECNADAFTTLECNDLELTGKIGIQFFGVTIDNYCNESGNVAAEFLGDDFEGWGDAYHAYGYSSFQGIKDTELPNGWYGLYENTMSAQQLVYDKTIGADGSSGLKNNSTKAITLIHALSGGENVTLKWDVKKNFDTATNQVLEIYEINAEGEDYSLGGLVGSYDIPTLCNASEYTTVTWTGNLEAGLYGFRFYAVQLDNFVIEQAVAKDYQLTYVIDGETVESVMVTAGSTIEPLEAPEKEGYTFAGWENLPDVMPEEDVTVTGSYTVNSYLLSFYLDDVVAYSEQVDYGSALSFPDLTEQANGGEITWVTELPETMPACDVNIYGNVSYTLTYILDDEVFEVVTLGADEAIVPAEVPEKEGYTFAGWEELPDVMPAANISVTGSYAVNSYLLSFYVGGERVYSEAQEYGSAIVVPDFSELAGDGYIEWEDEIPDTMPAYDVEIHGAVTAGVESVRASGLADVYSVSGLLLYKDVPLSTLPQLLNHGLYIVKTGDAILKLTF